MSAYKKMIESARKDGVTNTEKMWESISAVEDLLEEVDDKKLQVRFLRKQHEILYGKHYDELMATSDIGELTYTDRDGISKMGAHWSCSETETGMRTMPFAASVTKWDKWVAANIMYADLCNVLTDEQVLRVAHSFFFADEDWPQKDCKVWDYISMKECCDA